MRFTSWGGGCHRVSPRNGDTMAHDNWETPPNLFHLLNKEYQFDVDAAASKSNALCSRYITQEQNALCTPWVGRSIWCNPPYSMLPAFVYRAYHQSVEQQNQVSLLIPAYTDTRYWADVIVRFAVEIRFLVGRVSFLEGGKSNTTARFPSAFVRFSSDIHIPQHIWWWDWKAKQEGVLCYTHQYATGSMLGTRI